MDWHTHTLPVAQNPTMFIESNQLPAPRPRPRLFRLHRDQEGSIRFLGQFFERLTAMSKRLEGQGELLADEVWRLYAAKAPTLGMWVALDGADQVVGHILAQILPYNGRLVGWVTQVESDAVVSAPMIDDVIDTLEEWVRAFNAAHARDMKGPIAEMIFETARGDAWIRHSGWERYRTTFRRMVR